MSKVLKAVVISAYGALLLQYLRITFSKNTVDIEIKYLIRPPGTLKKILYDLRNSSLRTKKLLFSYDKPNRLPTDLKFILKWTNAFSHYSSSIFKNGQMSFIDNECPHFNCFMTNDKSLLVDPRYFDAVLFDVENNWDEPPVLRAAHQKYIFTASESANNYPQCHPLYDNYYNLTWTYKVDSDIRWSYVTIEDTKGRFVGPKADIKWVNPMKPTPERVLSRLIHKKKAAAWFVSHCTSRSGREVVGKALIAELARYDLKVDTFGWCGELSCPRDRIDECLQLLEEKYYFYFAFENSKCEDYVTEKLLYPLLHMTVPVVYGGANYSRFLPPGSYINAGELNITEVAILMNSAIKNPQEYRNYFRWHNHYVYKESPTVADVCQLCEVLNNPKKEYSVVNNFRKWWDPNFEESCQEEWNQTKQITELNENKLVKLYGLFCYNLLIYPYKPVP